jgi:hypothetical protein
MTTVQPTDQVPIRRPGSWTQYYVTSANLNKDVLDEIRLVPIAAISDQVGDEIEIEVQLTKESDDASISEQKAFYAFLTDDEDGETLTVTAPTGGWTKASNGTIINFVANKAGLFVTDSEGLIGLTVEDSGTKTFYLNMIMPNGLLYGGLPIAFDSGTSP